MAKKPPKPKYTTGSLTWGPSRVGNDLFSVYRGVEIISTAKLAEDAQLYAAAPDMLVELRRLYEKHGNQATADVIAKAEGSS